MRDHSQPTLLIYRIGQLGDTLVALPAIERLRRRYSDHRMVLLTNRQPAASGRVSSWEVLGPTGWFDDVIFYEPGTTRRDQLRAFLQLGRQMRSIRPNHVFNLVSRESGAVALRDNFFFRWVAAPAHYHDPGALPKRESEPAHGLVPMEPEWRRLLRMTGDESGAATFRLPIPDDARAKGAEVLLNLGGTPGTAQIAIGPGSKMPSKRWPQERFAALGAGLIDRHPEAHLLVFGGEADAAMGDALCRRWGRRAINLAGRLAVFEAAAVLQQCAAYVGNDTGTMHLAAMAGTPCVGIFSARDNPGKWEPYGDGHLILRHETRCAGCMLEICNNNNECLTSITVERVLSAATRLYTQRTTRARAEDGLLRLS